MQMPTNRFGFVDALLAVIVLLVAGGLRVGYVVTYCDADQPAPVQVQDADSSITLVRPSGQAATDLDGLVDNLRHSNWYGNRAPLADREEETARVSPGYPWLVATLAGWLDDPATATQGIRLGQCALGALTAVFYFLFTRLAFGSSFVGFLAGLLTAINPFWIVNVAELQEGTLASFLLASCLFLGTASTQRGNVLGSLLFGGSLAGMTLVRAALLPYAFVACLWFLLHCRNIPRGWVCALLAVLGFANGLAPWMVRDLRAFGDVMPITDSLYLDLWMGNNKSARGGPQSEETLRESLPPERLKQLMAEPNQARRYGMLAEDLKTMVQDNPTGVIEKRMRSGVCFLVGAAWFTDYTLARALEMPAPTAALPRGLPLALRLALFVMFTLGLMGWRWSYGWNREANLASLAFLWIPLPYILSHAEDFSGPRLPLDGVLLAFAAFAMSWMLPPVARVVFPEDETPGGEES
jgi:hypothetical protein